MRTLARILDEQPDFTGSVVEPVIMDWIKSNGLHMGNVMNAFRLTVVGECKGPHMFDVSELMGKEETIRRILAGVERIKPADASA